MKENKTKSKDTSYRLHPQVFEIFTTKVNLVDLFEYSIILPIKLRMCSVSPDIIVEKTLISYCKPESFMISKTFSTSSI